jgi:hypothetical protein
MSIIFFSFYPMTPFTWTSLTNGNWKLLVTSHMVTNNGFQLSSTKAWSLDGDQNLVWSTYRWWPKTNFVTNPLAIECIFGRHTKGGSSSVRKNFPTFVLMDATNMLGQMLTWCPTQNGRITLVLITLLLIGIKF